jgi:hypothetical protein
VTGRFNSKPYEIQDAILISTQILGFSALLVTKFSIPFIFVSPRVPESNKSDITRSSFQFDKLKGGHGVGVAPDESVFQLILFNLRVSLRF